MRLFALVVTLVACLLVATEARKGGLKKASFAKASSKDTKKKNSALVAVPNSKKGTKGAKRGVGGGIMTSVLSATKIVQPTSGGIMHRFVREMRSQFSSELEALTLSLTKPTDSIIPSSSMNELVQCFNSEYDNPQLVVSMFAKFSRKMCESSSYTKMKSLSCIHHLMANTNDKGQQVMDQCIQSLRNEHDSKVDMDFFSEQSIEMGAETANSVGELEMAELSRAYAAYVFSYIRLRGDREYSPKKSSDNPPAVTHARAQQLLEVLQRGLKVEAVLQSGAKQTDANAKKGKVRGKDKGKGKGKGNTEREIKGVHKGKIKDKGKSRSGSGAGIRLGPLAEQALQLVQADRAWALKQLVKLHDTKTLGAKYPETNAAVEALLQSSGVSHTPFKAARAVEVGVEAGERQEGTAGSSEAEEQGSVEEEKEEDDEDEEEKEEEDDNNDEDEEEEEDDDEEDEEDEEAEEPAPKIKTKTTDKRKSDQSQGKGKGKGSKGKK